MNHRNKLRRFNRNTAARKALFKNLCISLIQFDSIKTTLPKAKELRMYIEPLINLAKVDSVAHRRQAFAYLRDKDAVAKLFNIIGPASLNRQGGYTRILKCGFRPTDAAPVAYIQIVDQCKVS